MKYTQLTQEQRYQIHALLKMEHSRTEIADTLGVHRSTISRELRRNRGKRGYRPKQAHQFALQRRKKARKMITADIWALVEEKLPGGSKKKVFRSVMNISINTFMQTSVLVETYGSIFVVRRNGGNVSETTTAGAKFPTERVLMSVRK